MGFGGYPISGQIPLKLCSLMPASRLQVLFHGPASTAHVHEAAAWSKAGLELGQGSGTLGKELMSSWLLHWRVNATMFFSLSKLFPRKSPQKIQTSPTRSLRLRFRRAEKDPRAIWRSWKLGPPAGEVGLSQNGVYRYTRLYQGIPMHSQLNMDTLQ